MVYLFGIARALGGAVVLRMEDHDTHRCRDEFIHSIQEDLSWLFPWTDGTPWIRRRDRSPIYERTLNDLLERNLAYPCTCSRKEILDRHRKRGQEILPGDEIPYDGHCRNGTSPQTDRPVSHRLILPDDEVEFVDGVFGMRKENPARMRGDQPIRNNRGEWSYQFTVTLDDFLDRINLIVRGEDLLPSTARQLVMARLLGRSSRPFTCHHPVLKDAKGRKLSKSDGDGRGLRSMGLDRSTLIGTVLYEIGYRDKPGKVHPEEIGEVFQERFDFSRFPSPPEL